MRSISIARPASALAVASVSLLVGFGATADAAVKVSGNSVKKSSLPGNRVMPNSLTGIQINEAKLGLVPVSKLAQFAELARHAETARTADTAKTAESANTANSAKTAETANSARTAETANSARTAETANTAENAKKLNGRDHTAFLSNTVRTVVTQVDVANNGSRTLSVGCNADEKAIGGGGAWLLPGGNTPSQNDATLSASMPVPAEAGVNNMTGWNVTGRNAAGSTRTLRVYATCVPLNVAP